jgi:hypothetical protein
LQTSGGSQSRKHDRSVDKLEKSAIHQQAKHPDKGIRAAFELALKSSMEPKKTESDKDHNSNDASLLQQKALQESRTEFNVAKTVEMQAPPPAKTVAGSSAKDIRPNQGGKPDTVEFGIILKEMFSIDFALNTFSADVVVTLKWQDNRTTGLVPAGSTSVTFPTPIAKKSLWLPDVSVTNRDRFGYEVISTAVVVNVSGVVTKTERAIATMRNFYDVRAFPFDTQNLSIHIASTTLMADELVLAINGDRFLSGVGDKTLDEKSQFLLSKVSTAVYEELDGNLRKSRGYLNLVVTRHARPLIASALVPEFMLLCISWCVFQLPLLPPFVVPRVMTSLISLLALMTYNTRTEKLLPASRNGLVWLEVWEECCQILMFFGIVWNTLIEAAYHQWKCIDLAESMNTEVKCIFVALSAVMGALLWWWIDGDDLETLVTIARLCLFTAFAAYLVSGCVRIQRVLRIRDAAKSGKFTVNLQAPLGIIVLPASQCLKIDEINAGSNVDLYNRTVEPDMQICRGDYIVEINGISGSEATMREELGKASAVTAVIMKDKANK